MKRSIVLVLTGTAVVAVAAGGSLAAAAAGTASHGTTVTVRIEGVKKTLELARPIKSDTRSITKYGAPKGKCPGRSAQGALDAATGGHWKGTWYSQYNEYLITSILGEKPSGHNFWEIFVGHRAATKGACDLALRSGEQLIFADTDGKEQPSALEVPSSATAGTAFTVKLVGYSSEGKAQPLSGVRIEGNGVHSTKTNSGGVAKVTAQNAGKPVLRAAPAGYIRSEAVVDVKH
jgi:hypothetical protein